MCGWERGWILFSLNLKPLAFHSFVFFMTEQYASYDFICTFCLAVIIHEFTIRID
jgi:hypothetical protein